ncbi:hypothetical protein U3516DRAFT_734910 [Neocallimastix sp. 'constans']
MSVCLTAIPVRQAKKLYIEALYAIFKGKSEPTIGGLIAIPEELESVIFSDKAYAMRFLKC